MHPFLEKAVILTNNRIIAANHILQFTVRPGNQMEDDELISYGLCQLQKKDLTLAKMIFPPYFVTHHFSANVLLFLSSPCIITQVHHFKGDHQDLRVYGGYIKDGNNNFLAYYVENVNNRLTQMNKSKLITHILTNCTKNSVEKFF